MIACHLSRLKHVSAYSWYKLPSKKPKEVLSVILVNYITKIAGCMELSLVNEKRQV